MGRRRWVRYLIVAASLPFAFILVLWPVAEIRYLLRG